MLVVTTLLEASWPVRVGLVLVVLLLGLVYLLWEHRAEIAASSQAERADTAPAADGTPEATTKTTAPDPADTDPAPTQGDPSHE
jgi:cell division protein FtsN